jgi:cyclopropane-fatty-acyl-phospholipid synthase
MSQTDGETEAPVAAPSRPMTVLDRWAREVALRLLEHLQDGGFTLVDDSGTRQFGTPNAGDEHRATVTVRDPRCYWKLLFGGEIGAAEAYMNGYWTCSDLVALIRMFARNSLMMKEMARGWAWLTYPLNTFLHSLRANTLRGSRRNIAAHYDLSNDFFAQFLDETMTYSCAIFEREDASLEEASVAKLDRVCRKLALTPEDHVLEIGTGWGSFAIHAAKHYGCQVTTTTISRQQYELAQARAEAAGVGEQVEFLLKDYRELEGQYAKIASIEMIEAVGWEYLDGFFRKCSELLMPDGTMAIQAITSADQDHEQFKRGADFIKRYIFPGGCVLSVTAIVDALTRATDMRLVHLEDITPHYAKTLRMWRERFYANLDQIRRMGFDERFVRMWEFYLAYCEGGFMERVIGDVQMVLAKPAWRRPSILGLLPARPLPE